MAFIFDEEKKEEEEIGQPTSSFFFGEQQDIKDEAKDEFIKEEPTSPFSFAAVGGAMKRAADPFLSIPEKLVNTVVPAIEKTGRGLANIKEGLEFTRAAGGKAGINSLNKLGLISNEAYTKANNLYGGEKVTTLDLLSKARKDLGLGILQTGFGAFEAVITPISATVGEGINLIQSSEELITGEKEGNTKKTLDFIEFASKSIGEDILETAGYNTADYSIQEASDIGEGALDFVEGGVALKTAAKLNKVKAVEEGMENASINNNIEAMAEEAIPQTTTPTDPEDIDINLEIQKLTEANNLTLEGYSELMDRLGIDDTNIKKTIEQNAKTDNVFKYDENLVFTKKEFGETPVEVNPLLRGVDLDTKAQIDAAVKKITRETKASKAEATSIVNKRISDIERQLTKQTVVDDFAKIQELNAKRKTLLRNKSNITYDGYKDASKSDALIRLEDKGYAIKSVNKFNENLYAFDITPEGLKYLERRNVGVDKLRDGLTLIDKEFYDKEFISSSSEVTEATFNKKVPKILIDDINFGSSEFSKLKKLVSDYETGKQGDTILSDIYGRLETLNNRYNLGLDKKISDMVDVVTGELDIDKLNNILSDIRTLSKTEFITLKNINKQASTLKQKLNVEEKINNEVFKAGKKEGIEEGKLKVKKLKEIYDRKVKDIKDSKDLKAREKAFIASENYRLKKLQVEAKRDKANAVYSFIIDSADELARNKSYKIDTLAIRKVIGKNFFKHTSDKQLKGRIARAQEIIAKEQSAGIMRAINKELNIKNKNAKFSIKEVQLINGAKKLYSTFHKGEASIDDMLELLIRIREIKKLGKVELKKKKAALAVESMNVLDKINEEEVGNLKGSKPDTPAGEIAFWKSAYAKFRQGFNELNFMYRIMETLGKKSPTFTKVFLYEVDGVYNKVLSYKDSVVDKIIIDIDKEFKTPKERAEVGQYLALFRRKIEKDGSVKYEGYEKLKGDKTSWLNQKRTSKPLDVKPTKLDWMTDEIWEDVRKSKLGETLEKGLTDKRYTNLQERLRKEFTELRGDVDGVMQLYDNAELRGVIDYFPFQTVDRVGVSEIGGFDDPAFASERVGDGFTKHTTNAKNVYEWDVARVTSNGLVNEKYYTEMRPQYERMKDVLYGRKIKDVINETPAIKGETEVANRGGGIMSNFDKETVRIMEIYMERIRTGGDKYGTLGNFFNRAVGYVNNQYLGFNPGTILKQGLSFFDAAGIIGTRNVTWAMNSLWNRDLVHKALDASAGLRNRFGGEISSKDLEQLSTGTAGKYFNKSQKIAMSGIRLSDQFVATKVWMAAYRKYLIDNGLLKENKQIMSFDNIEGVEFADIMMQKAMGTVNPLMLPPAYRNAFTKVVGQLMTTQLNRLGILFNDIPDLYREGENMRATIGLGGYITSSIGDKAVTAAMGYYGYQLGIYAWEGYDKDFMEIFLGGDDEETLKKLGEYALSDLFGGSQVKAMFTGDDYLVIGGFISKIGKDVVAISEAEDSEEVIQGFFDLAGDSFGTWAGRRIADFYENQ